MAIQSAGSAFEPALGIHLPNHAQSVEQCLRHLETSLQGLSTEDAQERLKTLGKTELSEFAFQRPKPKQVFMGAFKNHIAWLFLAAAGTSLYTGRYIEGLLVIIAMLANGFIQGLIQWHKQSAPMNWCPAIFF
jgi:magnesium-transporting ATPase (P-type)